VLAESGHLLHFAKDERAYIPPERFLLPQRESLPFPLVRTGAAHIVRETALSSSSRLFS